MRPRAPDIHPRGCNFFGEGKITSYFSIYQNRMDTLKPAQSRRFHPALEVQQ
jgi:hypothetical protein